MRHFLFVGERPSLKAHNMGVTWKDGRLAAKQLFDGLSSAGIKIERCKFDNLFLLSPFGPEKVSQLAVRRIRYSLNRGLVVVAMGKKIDHELSVRNIDHLSIVHPAARGRIRKKERYASHLISVLLARERS